MHSSLRKLAQLLEEKRRVHLVGIGGIGMASLAIILQERGFEVSGCDLQLNDWTAELSARGIPVYAGHDQKYVREVDWCIRSTAVPLTHPLFAYLEKEDKPLYQRGIVLGFLMRSNYTIAVAGSHGKTTTASILAKLLSSGYVIGGAYQGDHPLALDHPRMVVEVDESDGTLVHFQPDILLLTNVDYDHLENHGSKEKLLDAFGKLIANTRVQIYYFADDPLSCKLCEGMENASVISQDERASHIHVPSLYNQKNTAAALQVADRILARAVRSDEVAAVPAMAQI